MAHPGKLVSHSDLPFIPSPVASTNTPGGSSHKACGSSKTDQITSLVITSYVVHMYNCMCVDQAYQKSGPDSSDHHSVFRGWGYFTGINVYNGLFHPVGVRILELLEHL